MSSSSIFLATLFATLYFPITSVAHIHDQPLVEIRNYQEVLQNAQDWLKCGQKQQTLTKSEEEICALSEQIDEQFGTILSLSNKQDLNEGEIGKVKGAIEGIAQLVNGHFERGIAENRQKLAQLGWGKLSEVEGKLGKIVEEHFSKKGLGELQNRLKAIVKGIGKIAGESSEKERGKKGAKDGGDGQMQMLELSYEGKLIVEKLANFAGGAQQQQQEQQACPIGGGRAKRATGGGGGCCNCCGIPFGQITVSFFKFLGHLLGVPKMALWYGWKSFLYGGKTICYAGCQGVCGIWYSLIFFFVGPCNPKARLFGKCIEPPATAFRMLFDKNVPDNQGAGEATCSCWGKMGTDIRAFWKFDDGK